MEEEGGGMKERKDEEEKEKEEMNKRHAAATQVTSLLHVKVVRLLLTYGFLHVLNVLAILSEYP